MYYLLGYKLLGATETDKTLTEDSEMDSKASKTRNRKKGKSKKDNLSRPIKALFNRMDNEQYERVCYSWTVSVLSKHVSGRCFQF